jgi:hypothetical protein
MGGDVMREVQRQDEPITEAEKLRKLAAWYREFAERTENDWIWAARLRKADALEIEASEIEARQLADRERRRGLRDNTRHNPGPASQHCQDSPLAGKKRPSHRGARDE